jgi:NAD(P)-dependent dehydrogenase (short-subunit alcohol dehydrogenase family)
MPEGDMVEDFHGQVAIVTGAGRRGGIGAAIAHRLAQAGAHLVLADLCAPPTDLELPNPGGGQWQDMAGVAAEAEALGVRVLPLRVDVTDAVSVEDMVAETLEAFGRLDILVNNAGAAIGPAPVVQMEEAAWRRTLEINATGTFLCCKYGLPPMIEAGRGGRVINMASLAAERPRPGVSAYAAGKAAVVALTRSLAQEVAQFDITVNAVLPGDVDTELKRWSLQLEALASGRRYDDVLAAATRRVPLGRFATPGDVASLVAFLASAEAAFITGQAYVLSGGREWA